MVEAPEQAVGEEGRSRSLRARGVLRVEHTARPVALGLLRCHHALGHTPEFLFEEGAVLPVGGHVGQHLGQPGEYPAVAARPEILLTAVAFVGRIYIFAVAEI